MRESVAKALSFRARHTGFVLVIVLIVIAALALAAYTFTELMLSHQQSTQLAGLQLQARTMVDSGSDAVQVFLIQDKATREESGGVFDNPDRFQGIVVIPSDEPRDRGSFSVIAPKLDDNGQPGGVRYGLEDESTRLNLNSLVFLDQQPSAEALAAGAQLLSGGAGGNSGALGAGGLGAGTPGSGAQGSNAQGSQSRTGPQGSNGQGSNQQVQNQQGNQGSGAGGNRGGSGGNSGGANANNNPGRTSSTGGLTGGTANAANPLGGGSGGGTSPGASGDGSGNGRKLLLALPGMTEEIADAILDWLDEDDEPREYGCEREHYSGLDPPYAPKNGPCETVEELLLVRGVTPELLFGRDVNHNGMIDQHEEQLPAVSGGEDSTGALDRGWSAYLTLFSQERNSNRAGKPRIFVNQEDLQQLHNQLSEVFSAEWANFIVLLRQNGPSTSQTTVNVSGGSGTNQPTSASGVQMDLSKPSKYQLIQVLDLIDAKVSVTPAGGSPTVVKSPFTSDLGGMGLYLPSLMDNLTINQAPTIPGRININQAPRTILEGIPTITPEIVNEIISRRDLEISKGNPNRSHETWILAESICTLAEMKALSPFICGGGDVFRAQIVGYFQGGVAASRAEVVFDATQAKPRLLLWRDMSHLGRGYALETLGVDLSGP